MRQQHIQIITILHGVFHGKIGNFVGARVRHAFGKLFTVVNQEQSDDPLMALSKGAVNCDVNASFVVRAMPDTK
jgi:hypothetical protein